MSAEAETAEARTYVTLLLWRQRRGMHRSMHLSRAPNLVECSQGWCLVLLTPWPLSRILSTETVLPSNSPLILSE